MIICEISRNISYVLTSSRIFLSLCGFRRIF